MTKARTGRVAAAFILVAATGAAFAGSGGAQSRRDAPRCELEVARKGSSIQLTALAHSAERASGDYRLHVSGAGTEINQGGPFAVAPGRSATLGTVTLGSGGAGYDADLQLRIDGETISCERRVGGV